MFKDRVNIIKLSKKFVQICKTNNIWYALDNGSLLGAVRNNGIIPWDDDFDVMMTIESFHKLKSLFPDKIIDTDESGYPLLIPKFMASKKDYLTSAVFVDIFLLIPTNEERIRKFTSFKNKARFAMQCTHSKWHKFNFGSKIFWLISWPFKWIPKKMSLQEAIGILKVENKKATHFFTIDNPIDPIRINKQKILSLKTQKVFFEDFLVNIPIEYHDILINKYSKNYMKPVKTARSIEHINAISIKKVNRKKRIY